MTAIDPALFELFRDEVRAHADTLAAGLLDLEADAANPRRVEPLMRAAHSIKGAARIVGIDPAVRLAHGLEDTLVAAQAGRVRVTPADIDHLLQGADALAGLGRLADAGGIADWVASQVATIDRLEAIFQARAAGHSPVVGESAAASNVASVAPPASSPLPSAEPPAVDFPPAPPYPAAVIPPDPLVFGAEYGMLDVFREEVRAHLPAVAAGGEAMRAGHPPRDDVFEGLRQVAGAARMVKCPAVERVASAVAAYLPGAGVSPASLPPAAGEWLGYAVAVVAGVIETDAETFAAWQETSAEPLERVAAVFRDATRAAPRPGPQPPTDPAPEAVVAPAPLAQPAAAPPAEPVVRVTAQSLSRLMGLAGESLVQARWLHLFSTALLKLKKQHELLAATVDDAAASAGRPPEHVAALAAEARRQVAECRQELADQTLDFDDHAARAEDLNTRLYREVIASRMRPFGDGVHGLARMVRDIARALGKQARLVVVGDDTDVDRDVLEKLESPISHLIRNAVDHGIDPPAERAARGKPEVGTVRVEARHRAGMLAVTIADDGRGVDLDRLRDKVVQRGLSSPDLVRRMSDAELLEFLFLPGFTTAAGVTEFSGRGVGLDVVQDTVRRVGGGVRITTVPGRGTTFHLQLPITLSVIRAVVVEVGGEPYAFPHTRIDGLLQVPRADIRSLEHRQFVAVDGHNVGLVLAGQLLDVPSDPSTGADLPVVLLSDATGRYGLVVDAVRGEQDLVVRPLDPRLGKVPNLSAAAVLDDGEPVLIVDVEDLARSMDQFIQSGTLRRCEGRDAGPARKKRVLVAEDSITVREVERQLLAQRGYEVAVAVDGMDGWNQIRAGRYDLLVTDVDMPRMTGIQLVQAVRADEKLKNLPVVIVSYKEREDDRLRGLEAGANAYLTKSSFHDNRFAQTVEDLIGPP